MPTAARRGNPTAASIRLSAEPESPVGNRRHERRRGQHAVLATGGANIGTGGRRSRVAGSVVDAADTALGGVRRSRNRQHRDRTRGAQAAAIPTRRYRWPAIGGALGGVAATPMTQTNITTAGIPHNPDQGGAIANRWSAVGNTPAVTQRPPRWRRWSGGDGFGGDGTGGNAQGGSISRNSDRR